MKKKKRTQDEFVEVLTGLVQSHFKSMDNEKVDALIEDIISWVGRVDYRYLHEALTWEHCKCLDELAKLKKVRQ